MENSKQKVGGFIEALEHTKKKIIEDIVHFSFTGLPSSLKEDDLSKGGFFDLPISVKKCEHPEHEAPKHMVIPKGKGYKHICPNCGNVQIIIPTQTNL